MRKCIILSDQGMVAYIVMNPDASIITTQSVLCKDIRKTIMIHQEDIIVLRNFDTTRTVTNPTQLNSS